jgi:hypothetical protein
VPSAKASLIALYPVAREHPYSRRIAAAKTGMGTGWSAKTTVERDPLRIRRGGPSQQAPARCHHTVSELRIDHQVIERTTRPVLAKYRLDLSRMAR